MSEFSSSGRRLLDDIHDYALDLAVLQDDILVLLVLRVKDHAAFFPIIIEAFQCAALAFDIGHNDVVVTRPGNSRSALLTPLGKLIHENTVLVSPWAKPCMKIPLCVR